MPHSPWMQLAAILLGDPLVGVPPAVAAEAALEREREAAASGVVHGVVRDDAGAAVAGARIVVAGRRASAITDERGAFLVAASPGDVLEASASGYATVEATASADDRDLELVVTRLHVEATVLVHAPPDATSVATTVDREEILRAGAQTVTDVVAAIPGGSSAGRGGTYNVPALRGLARGRTLLMVGDARISSERRAGPGASFVPPAFLERVVALRGPLAVLDGSDAIGGSITLDLREPSHDAAPPAEVMLDGAPNGFGASVTAQGAGARWRGLAGAVHRDYDDYAAPKADGEVADTGFSGTSVLGRAIREGKRSRLDLTLLHHAGEELGRADNRYPLRRSSNPHDRWSLFDLRLTRQLGADAMLQASAAWIGSDVATRTQVYRGDGTLSRVESARDRASDVNLRVAVARAWRRAELRAGIDALLRGGLRGENEIASHPASGGTPSVAQEVPVDGGSNRDLGAFAGGHVDLGGDVRMLAGLRWDEIRAEADGHDARDASDWSGHAGLRWREGRPFGAGIVAGRAFRNPGVYQLFYTGLTGRGRIHANPDLPQESARTWDVEIFGATPRCRWEARAFRIHLEDFVDRVSIGDDFHWESLDEARLEGIEAAARWTLGGGWSLDASAQRMRGRDETTGLPLNDVPPHRLIARADWQGRRYRAGVGAELLDAIDDPGPEEREVPGAALIELSGGCRLGRGFDFGVRLDNALDQVAFPNADEQGIPLPGRTLSVTLAWRKGVH